MRLTTRRVAGFAVLVVVVVALAVSTGSHAPKLAAAAAMQQLAPRMRSVDEARAACEASVLRTPCGAKDVAATSIGTSIHLRAATACVAPGSACVSTDGDEIRVEIVSDVLPTIGGIRLEGRAQRSDPQLHWSCGPTRHVARADEVLVRRACGDVPRR